VHQAHVDVQPLRTIAGVLDVQQDARGVIQVEVSPGLEIRPQLASAIVTHGWGLLSMQKITLSLEEIFLELTTQEDDVVDATPVASDAVAEGA
jgi:ABC-2 type transport system ATP-binding protein